MVILLQQKNEADLLYSFNPKISSNPGLILSFITMLM